MPSFQISSMTFPSGPYKNTKTKERCNDQETEKCTPTWLKGANPSRKFDSHFGTNRKKSAL